MKGTHRILSNGDIDLIILSENEDPPRPIE